MRKLLFILGVLLFAQPVSAQLILKQSTSIDIRMGPFLDVADGITPITGATIAAADQAEVLKANGAATSAMAGTLAAVTGADGWYDYTVGTGDVDTVGEVVFLMQDASQYLPVFVRAYVVEEAVYDALFGAAGPGYLQPTTAGRTLDVTATGAAGVDFDNIEGTLDAAEIGADAITAAKVAADVTTEITAGLLKPISVGTAQAGGTSTQIILASTEDFSADDRINCAGVHIYSGTGKGQFKIITAYTNATDTATVDSAWAANPDATSVYQLLQLPCTITAAEFAGLVWDAATASYVVAGSTGKALGDVNTNLGTPASLGGGATVSQNLQDLADDNTATFDRTTDSLQAIRDRGDAAWAGSPAIVTGTADSGSTTTMVDAARTEADTDYWLGALIKFTSGNISGQTRYISGFTPGTDTITFDPPTTQAVSTNTYEILPGIKLTSVITLPKNTATTGNRISFFSIGTNGQFTTGATGVACTISLDGGAESAVTDTPVENEFGTDASTWSFDLTAAETNANQANIVCTGTGGTMRPAALHLEFQY